MTGLHAQVNDGDDGFTRGLLKVWLYRRTDTGRLIDYIRHEAAPDGTVSASRAQHYTGSEAGNVQREPEPLLIPADYARALAVELLRYCGDIDPGSAQALRADLEHERARRDLADDRLAETLASLLGRAAT